MYIALLLLSSPVFSPLELLCSPVPVSPPTSFDSVAGIGDCAQGMEDSVAGIGHGGEGMQESAARIKHVDQGSRHQ